MATLTDTKARSIKPEDKPIAHGGVTGLALHPAPTKGRGKWVLRFVSPVTGKRRNAGLGTYPEVSIAEATRQGQQMQDQVSRGLDPLEERAKVSNAPKKPTFKVAAETLHRELLPGWKNAKHGQQWINTLNTYAFKTLGNLALDQIQPSHIADVLRPIWIEKAETASRLKQRIHAVMAWGWAHGHSQANPVDVVDHLLAQQPGKSVRTQHQPAMPWRDIPDFYKSNLTLDADRSVTKAILAFVILTACRSGEARGVTWGEVNLEEGIWTIPATRMKAKLSHRVPLSSQAKAILAHQHAFESQFKSLSADDLVFPSPRKGIELSDMVLTSYLRRMEAKSDVPGRVATAHGFRSSFRDWCSEQGYARDLAERALAHVVQNKVEAAYHRTDLLEQRRPMMQAWADHVTPVIPASSRNADQQTEILNGNLDNSVAVQNRGGSSAQNK